MCNRLSASAPILTRAVWQCGGDYKELTERVEIMHMDLTKPLADVQGGATARSVC